MARPGSSVGAAMSNIHWSLALALVACASAPHPTPSLAPSYTNLDPVAAPGADRAVFVLRRERDGVLRSTDPIMAEERFRPMSTFKIPNSLVALETGVAGDANFALAWDHVDRGHS